MEELVDTVPAVRPDYAAVLALCVLLDDVSVLTEECAWLNNLDSLVQALSCSLRYPHRVWVGQSLVSDVECFVEIRMETAVVDGDVNVQDVAIFQHALVGDAVADDLV